jgi:hypothetical protein
MVSASRPRAKTRSTDPNHRRPHRSEQPPAIRESSVEGSISKERERAREGSQDQDSELRHKHSSWRALTGRDGASQKPTSADDRFQSHFRLVGSRFLRKWLFWPV